MQHIVEPTANVFFAASDVNQESLPVYDYDVESLAEGFATRLGVRNTWQTQRGGEGHWRSVDWLRLDTDVVLTGSETSIESPIARFFDYRPELGLWGDHFWGEAALQATDTLSFLGNLTYGFDSDRVERWELGASLEHNPHLGTFLAWRGVESLDSSVFQYGVEYRLTPKYFLTLAQSWDLNRGKNHLFSVTLTRRLPHWLLIFEFDYDAIEGETTVGIALTPEGLGGGGRPHRNPFLRDQISAIR